MNMKRMKYTGDSAMRIRSFTLLSLLLVLVLVGVSAYAGDETRTGTAGATELLIPVGGRSTALSGSTIASVSGADALFWNPAGACRIDGSTEVMFNSMNYIADIHVNYFALTTSVGGTGVFGVSIKTLNFGDIPITTTAAPEGTGSTYSPSYITFGVSYANKFTDRILGGFTLKYINEKIIETGATGIALDLGIQYISSAGLKLGVTLKNLGPQMQYSGQDLNYSVKIPDQQTGAASRALALPTSGFELPSTLEFGAGYDLKLPNDLGVIGLSGVFQNSNFGDDEFRFGAEYAWNNIIFLRGGITRTQNQDNNIYGPTFGIGINIPIGSTSVGFDYSYRKVEYFDGNQWINVRLTL
jgi:hypothetical protein